MKVKYLKISENLKELWSEKSNHRKNKKLQWKTREKPKTKQKFK